MSEMSFGWSFVTLGVGSLIGHVTEVFDLVVKLVTDEPLRRGVFFAVGVCFVLL